MAPPADGPTKPAAPAAPSDDIVTITTTLPRQPLPVGTDRTAVETERLIIRAYVPSDLARLNVLRSQPEVMVYGPTGKIDADLAATQKILDLFLPPNDTKTFHFAICLRDSGEFIGFGGCHNLVGGWGWPELGYGLMKEYWGQGRGTEFLRAWLEMYSALPRTRVKIKVPRASLKGLPFHVVEDGGRIYQEQLTASVDMSNTGSLRVLEKVGFFEFAKAEEGNSHGPRGKASAGFRYLLGRHGGPEPAE